MKNLALVACFNTI